jgi:acetyl-CoA synthetase
VGRKDDLITSAGYRIGPAEIEDCLIKHKSVAMAAVIGSPDPVRGEIVKAFIVLKPDVSPSQALHEEIQNFVKTRLAAHEYPREIDFVKELPMTTTGKIMRRVLRKMDIEKKRVS